MLQNEKARRAAQRVTTSEWQVVGCRWHGPRARGARLVQRWCVAAQLKCYVCVLVIQIEFSVLCNKGH